MNGITDKIFAAVGLALFAIFMGIVGWQVVGIDIKIVLILAFAMAAYDFWLDAFKPGPKSPIAPHEAPDRHDRQHDAI